jgi:hypothetical protein
MFEIIVIILLILILINSLNVELSPDNSCELYSNKPTTKKKYLVSLDDGDNGIEWKYTTKENYNYLNS